MYTDTDIDRIGSGLQNASLPKQEWTHAAHIAAAVWLLAHYDQAAFDLMPDMIRRYNEATGGLNSDTEGYHHTITLASLTVIQAAMGTKPRSLSEHVDELLLNGYDKPGWLLRHYSKDRLFSVHARRHWVDPDLKPLT